MGAIAIVSGASSGVGAEFVRQLSAGSGGPLAEIWAIARSEEALGKVVDSCKGYPVRVIALDLTSADAPQALEDLLAAKEHHVQWLVNCAGFGKFGPYAQVGRTSNAGMVALNCLALTNVTSVALPHMVAGSRVINLASIAGLVPQPELATYSATKAFVVELSRLLNHELQGTGICVTAVCPKFMRTRFLDSPGNEEAARRMTAIGFEEVQRVVAKSLRAAVRGKSLCVTSWDMKAAHVVAKLLPRSVLFRLEDLLFRQ